MIESTSRADRNEAAEYRILPLMIAYSPKSPLRLPGYRGCPDVGADAVELLLEHLPQASGRRERGMLSYPKLRGPALEDCPSRSQRYPSNSLSPCWASVKIRTYFLYLQRDPQPIRCDTVSRWGEMRLVTRPGLSKAEARAPRTPKFHSGNRPLRCAQIQ